MNAQGDVIDTKPATAGNQHCAFVNIVNTLDEGGISHAGGTTYTTKQDVAVATGVVGVVTGGIALEAGATAARMLNSADDIGTNAKGESFLQQQFEAYKGTIGDVKTLTGIIGGIYSLKDMLKSTSVVGKANDVVHTINTIVNYINPDEK